MLGLALPGSAAAGGTATLVAVEWSSTVNLGAAVVGLLIAAGTFASILYGVRYRVGYEAASSAAGELRKALDDSIARGERLEAALAEASARLEEQAVVIQRLEALPNLERIVNLMSEESRRADERATERMRRGIAAIEDHFETAAAQTAREAAAETARQVEALAVERHEAVVSALHGVTATLERLYTQMVTSTTPGGSLA